MNRSLGKKIEPYLWLAPSIILMTIFVMFPIAIVFRLSFSEVSKSGIVGGFVGFQNFAEAISLPAFKTVMLNTLYWVVSVVCLSTVIGFIVAFWIVLAFIAQRQLRLIVYVR